VRDLGNDFPFHICWWNLSVQETYMRESLG
jgi:hypothetical protein